MILAVHGNPGSPADFDLLFQDAHLSASPCSAVPATQPELEAALLRSPDSETTVIGYSWGAYLVMQTLLSSPKFRPRNVILVAPYLAPADPLKGFANILVRTPVVSRIIAGLSQKKWQQGLEERMFHPKDLESAKGYLARLNSSKAWTDMLKRKVLQQDKPLVRGQNLTSKIHIIFGERDRITDQNVTENLMRSLGIPFDAQIVSGAEHALIWTHSSVLAVEIARIHSQLDPTSKGISQ